MAETLSTKSLTAEIQIHATGINLAAPVGGEMQATVEFRKVLVDPATGEVLQYVQWDAASDGLNQVSLDQAKIIELVTLNQFAVIRDEIHTLRRQPVIDAAAEQGD